MAVFEVEKAVEEALPAGIAGRCVGFGRVI